jgi:hypothetical protein
MAAVISEFDVKKDGRNRITLRNVSFDYYHAKVFDGGHIEFYPRVLVDASLSLRTLLMIDVAIINYSRRKTGSRMNPRDLLADVMDQEK